MKVQEPSFPRKRGSSFAIGADFERANTEIYREAKNEFGNDISIKLLHIILLGIMIIIFNACSSTREFSEYENIEGNFIEDGIASWYGPDFHGNKTANGERFNTNELTAAHRTLPFNSILRVINAENSSSVIVRINDRGPFVKNRIIDLSKKAAEELDIIRNGTARVKLFLLNNVELPNNLAQPNFTVQVGSYKFMDDAINFARNINDSRVVKANINEETYFRVYVGKFISIHEAEELLHELKRNGINGFVKQVEN